MQGKRTDLSYDKIVEYVAKKQPLLVTHLHAYLRIKYKMLSSCNRSRLIGRLEGLGAIKRIGNKYSNKCTFIINEDNQFYDNNHT